MTNEQLLKHIDTLHNEIRLMEVTLSRQITKEVTDTFWKIIPITLGLMALVNSVLYLSIKSLMGM